MQGVVSRHTADKLNKFFLAGLQPANSAKSPHGWRSLGCSRNFILQTMESSVRFLIGNGARILCPLPGGNNGGKGGCTLRISSSSIPRAPPAVARSAFRGKGVIVIVRRLRSTSTRVGNSGDFSPQRLLDSAVDVLRKFNEKVNNMFQRGGGGDGGSRDFATVSEEKVVTSVENVFREENGALEHVDVLSEQEQGSGFEWFSALWEAEVSSVEKSDAGCERECIISSEGSDIDILQHVSGSFSPDSAVSETEMIEETTPVAISLPPEVHSPEKSIVIQEFPAESSIEIEKGKISPVKQEETADPGSGQVSSSRTQVDTSSPWTGLDVPESTLPCEAPEIEVRADNKIEDAALTEEAIIANQSQEHPENLTVVGNVQHEASVAEPQETEVWLGFSRSVVTGSGIDLDISQLGGSTYPESVLSEGSPKIGADESIEEATRAATSANGLLEQNESRNVGSTVQVLESTPSAEIEGEAFSEADLKILVDDRFKESMVEAITDNQEVDHPQIALVDNILTGRDAGPEEVKEVDIGELWNRNSSEYSSLVGLELASSDGTESGQTLLVEVVEEESNSIIGKSDKAGNANEELDVGWVTAPVDGHLDSDSLTLVSFERGEGVVSNLSGGQTSSAGEAGAKHEVETGAEEFGDPFGEELVANDAKVPFVSSSTDINTGGLDDLALRHEISRLRKSISHHAYLYHTLGVPSISDAAYDSLVKELVDLEAQVSTSESSLNDSVAAPPSPEMLKVIHSVPMLSLASVQKEEDVVLWYGKLQQKLGLDNGWVVEPKVDGLALSLRYELCNLKWAATRGNGIQGEDVTHNAQRVVGIPLTIPPQIPGTECPLTVLEVRGEIFMSLDDFKELNASKIRAGEKPFASPRNAAAGSMRLLSSNSYELRPLSFMAYSVAVIEAESTGGGPEKSSLVPTNQWEVLQFLNSAGFAVNEDNRLFESFDSALEYAKRWKSMRKNLTYEADGVVLKVNDLGIQTSLGSTGTYPRWALAWKFAATEVVSVLEGIDLTIGRSGAMIPNARLKPVELGGAVISRASLHNFGHVKALGLCEGDHVVVQRAGDVIPQVVQVLEDLRPESATPWVPPEQCPTCGSTLTEASAKPMVFCSNSTCPSRHSRQVGHFAKTLISGLGSATLSRLEEEFVKDPADFYHLDELALSKMKGFGKQSIKRLLKAIEESKHQDLWLFIAALGIPKVGTNTAKELAKKFGSLEALLGADVSSLMGVPGIGAATASCIFDWCHSDSNIELVNSLKLAGCKVGGTQITETNGKGGSTEDGLTNESAGEPDVVEEGTKTAVSAGDCDVVEDVEDGIETDAGETPGILEKNDELFEYAILEPTSSPLSGKSIVITGDFGTIKREDIKKMVTLHGGVVRTSVTSRTSFVLCGNRPGPLKIAEASRRGVEMLDLQGFLSLIGQRVNDTL